MVREHESTAQRDRIGMRGIALAAIAVIVAAAAIGLVRAQRWDSFPEGTIGYREGEKQAWVNARGVEMDEPEGWLRKEAAQPLRAPGLGAAQYPSPDGEAVAFVRTTRDDGWSVSRLMVKEGDRVSEVALIGAGESPPLLVSTKGGARSRGGVPLIVAWSPDGRKLAWGSVADPPYNLQLAERGVWAARSLPLVGGWVGELAWSPDARYLAISTYAENRTDHTILMLDALGAEPPQQVAKGCVMVWSPDSRYLALHGEPKSQLGLWVVSVDGEARRIIDREVAPFAWVE